VKLENKLIYISENVFSLLQTYICNSALILSKLFHSGISSVSRCCKTSWHIVEMQKRKYALCAVWEI